MKIDNWIRKKVKQEIFSREPHPVLPFVLFFIILLIGFYIYNLEISWVWSLGFFILASLTLIFAFAHWYVWKISK